MAVTLQTLAIPGIFISYSLPPLLDAHLTCFKKKDPILSLFCFSFFVYVFGGLDCVGHSFANVPLSMFFQRCLDSNPERSKQALFQLITTHPTQPFISVCLFLGQGEIIISPFQQTDLSFLQHGQIVCFQTDLFCLELEKIVINFVWNLKRSQYCNFLF